MDSKSFGNPTFDIDSLRNAESDGKRMTRAGVAMWLSVLLVIFGATFGFQFYSALEAFKGIDFELIQRVDSGQVDSDNKPIYETKYLNPEKNTYEEVPKVNLNRVMGLMWIGSLGGLGVGLVCIFFKKLSPLLAPIYAGLEGLALGGVSAAYELQFGGIVMQAAAGTVGVLIVMYLLFSLGLIRVGDTGAVIISSLLLGMLGIYIADLVLPMFGGEHFSFIHSNSWWSIGFSLFACGLGAFCLAVDFETIEQGIEDGAPKYMEAYCAFSVFVTLVWLYLEILRLLAKAQSRKN